MRIGIDVTCWSNRRGFGRFARELIHAMLRLNTGDEWLLVADRQTADSAQLPGGCRMLVGETKVSPTQAAAADGRRSIPDVWVMRKAVQRERLDVLFFPAVYTYFPVAKGPACVVTFHDAIAETLPHLIFKTRRSHWFWRMKCRLALNRSKMVLTVSEASKRGLVDHFRLAPERVAIMSEAASDAFRPVDTAGPEHSAALKRCGLSAGEKFLLYVGGISPHKNIATLIDAFGRLAGEDSLRRLRLVLVGDYTSDVFRTCQKELVEQAGRLGIAERVSFPGYVPDADLAHLYAACEAFIFPSYLEGFGLPAVEAMACGAAVLASDRGSLPEVLGGAGIHFDPHDAASLAMELRRVLSDAAFRNKLRAQSLERAKKFSWEQSARRAVEVLHEAAR